MQSSKEQQEEISLLQQSIQRNRGKQQNWKDQRSLQENKRYQGNISCKNGLDEGQKSYDLNQIPYDYTVEVRNRFKGLDLIERVLEELWTEVRDIVQETGIKNIPMENKCIKAKWLSGEALQMAVKRREAKSKGEKERYKHLNAKFQRIARRDKPSSAINSKKQRKTTKLEGLEISSRK